MEYKNASQESFNAFIAEMWYLTMRFNITIF